MRVTGSLVSQLYVPRPASSLKRCNMSVSGRGTYSWLTRDLHEEAEEEAEEEDEEHGNSVKISITCITPVLQAILDFFPDIISFQHVFHLGIGRSQMEWKLKVKTQILVFPWANIGQNDHSNPYIESTTVLSDYVNK